MMNILNRPMVKEALVLVLSGVISAMVCGRVYAATPTDAEQTAAPTATAPAPPQGQYPTQLAPMSKEEGRQMLLSSFFGQVPLAAPTPAAGR
ncbi:MAG: hypothetical protein WCP68_00450 [Enhydrobacter sp.]